MADEKVQVSVERGDNPAAPFVLKFTGESGIQDTIVSQVLKMAARRKNIAQPEPVDHFSTSGEDGASVTRGSFHVADQALFALQLIDETLNGIASGSIPKADIFPGELGGGIQLFTLEGVTQAGMKARAIAQEISQGRQ